MSDSFKEHLEIAEVYFCDGLPYWCNDFSRPVDEEFAKYLNVNGYKVDYLILELFDPVYIPQGCDYERVLVTAKERRKLREQGVDENDLPLLLF